MQKRRDTCIHVAEKVLKRGLMRLIILVPLAPYMGKNGASSLPLAGARISLSLWLQLIPESQGQESIHQAHNQRPQQRSPDALNPEPKRGWKTIPDQAGDPKEKGINDHCKETQREQNKRAGQQFENGSEECVEDREHNSQRQKRPPRIICRRNPLDPAGANRDVKRGAIDQPAKQ